MSTGHTLQPAPNVTRDKERVPRVLIRAILLLLFAVTTMVAVHQALGLPTSGERTLADVAEERPVLIESALNGAARVLREDGTEIVALEAGKGVFISTIHRAMRRNRAQNNAAVDGPFMLRDRGADGLSVFDPSTGLEVSLSSYGRDNVAAFRALFD